MEKIVYVLIFLTFFSIFINYNQDKMANEKLLENIPKDASVATFAGGCFWCVESTFEDYEGVYQVISGYTGGDIKNPTYEQVSSGSTGHYEAVQVYYNEKIISYEDLLQIFWRLIDPTDVGGSFVDRGEQYSSAIFYSNKKEEELAKKSLKDLEESKMFDKPIVTKILPLKEFYVAEGYHQDYYRKNPVRYKFYRYNSGRDQFRDSVWGKDKDYEVEKKELISSLQEYITKENGTEKPFENEYYNNKKEGIYVDIYTGEPLFSSIDKYDSGTGWPSFTKPIDNANISFNEDNSLFSKRTEVRSTSSDSHLGHVFDDGPKPTGKRFCMNSAALKFIPKEDLEKEGYEDYLKLFD